MSSTSTASMQFTPEWLKPGRKQPIKQTSFSSLDEEPVRKGSADHPHSTAPSYSSLLSAGASPASAALDSGAVSGQGFQDAAHPFRYSKEQMLVVWKEGGPNKSVLGAEVARWPGIVRDTITEPVGLRELTVEEKKIFSQSLNSNPSSSNHTRRHGPSNTGPPVNTTIGSGGAKSAFTGGLGSPRTERFGGTGTAPSVGSTLTRRRKDETGDTPAPVGVYRPRQLSLSNPGLGAHSLSGGPLPSPRLRGGGGVDGVMGESWMRRKTSDRGTPTGTDPHAPDVPLEWQTESGDESSTRNGDAANVNGAQPDSPAHLADSPHSYRDPELYASPGPGHPATQSDSRPAPGMSLSALSETVNPVNSHDPLESYTSGLNHALPPQATLHSPTAFPNESVQWRYKDHDGRIQGPFGASTMQSWYERQYFQENLPIQRFEPPYDSLDPAAFEPLAEYKKKLPPTLEPFLFMKGMELAPPRPPNLPMPATAPAPLAEEIREQPMSTFPPSHSVSGGNPAPRSDTGFSIQNPNGGGNSFMTYPSSLANGSSNIPRSASGRHSSFDTFSGSGGIQNPGAAPSPLNSSPALSSGMAQSCGAASGGFVGCSSHIGSTSDGTAHSTTVPPISTERERQERDEFFKLLREKELASGSTASGPVRTNSVSSGMSGRFGNGLAGGGINVGQPVPRSPMFVNTAATSPIGPYQQGTSPAQSQAQHSYHSSFPHPSPYPQQQQGSVPPTPYQHPVSNNAWLQPPTGYLARQTAPPPPPSNIDIELPIDRQSRWGEPLPRDAYSQHPHQQEQIWPQQQQQEVYAQSQPISQRKRPPLSFANMAERYSTASALQSVHTQSAGNFGLPKGFVELPEQGSQQSAEVHTASQQPTETNTTFLPITDEQVDRLTSQFDDVQVQEPRLPQGLADSAAFPIATEAIRTVEPVADSAPTAESAKLPAGHNAKVADASPEEPPKPPVPAPSVAPPKGGDKLEMPEGVNSLPARPTRKASAPTPATRETAPVAPSAQAPASASASPVSPATAPAKPAPWSTLNSGSPANGGTSAGQSLREIQEAEARRSEARKEKEKAMRAAALAARDSSSMASASEAESIPKTTTWGLSVSQTGQASRGGSSSAAVTSSAPAAASTNAWSTPQVTKGGAVKKSMKEILEEEERRKKAVTAATHAQAQNAANGADLGHSSGKKAYVETVKAGDAKAPQTASGGGAWVTVGGKPSSPPNTNVPTRVPMASAVSSSLVKPASPAAPPKTAAAVVGKKASNSAPSVQDDRIPPPSTEFLKWTKEALRGLTGVNMDEFITMLLDFPIEPDASTMEIISDSVYANSSVLDGRRFATEFVSRRKTDVVRARNGSANGVGNGSGASGGSVGAPGNGWGKATSVADVVKAQPKPAEKEWGYKVVKKKGKKT